MSTQILCDGCGLEIRPEVQRVKLRLQSMLSVFSTTDNTYSVDLHDSTSCLAAWAIRRRLATLPPTEYVSDRAVIDGYRSKLKDVLTQMVSPFGRTL